MYSFQMAYRLRVALKAARSLWDFRADEILSVRESGFEEGPYPVVWRGGAYLDPDWSCRTRIKIALEGGRYIRVWLRGNIPEEFPPNGWESWEPVRLERWYGNGHHQCLQGVRMDQVLAGEQPPMLDPPGKWEISAGPHLGPARWPTLPLSPERGRELFNQQVEELVSR